MFHALTKKNAITLLTLAGSLCLLSATALQYPLSTTFPMGGDAPPYILIAKKAHNVFKEPGAAIEIVTSSWYPLTSLWFSIFSLVPLDWPRDFIWWATLGQVATGIALAWLLWRIGSFFPRNARWYMAAAGLAIWSLTPIELNNHFEDGTIAQLWSLVFLLLFFERLIAGSWRGMALLLALTIIAHPISAIVILATIGVAVLPLLAITRPVGTPERKGIFTLTGIMVMGAVIAGWILWQRQDVLSLVESGSGYLTLGHYVTSRIAPFIVLAPLGLFLLLHQPKKLNPGILIIAVFSLIATLFAFSDVFGAEAWTKRFHTYFILTLSLLGAIALPVVVQKAIPQTFVRVALLAILFASLFAQNWQSSAQTYAQYNNPDNLKTLHPLEQKGFVWLEKNLEPGQVFFGNESERISEWLPVYTSHHWQKADTNGFALDLAEGSSKATAQQASKYLLFFLKRQKIPQPIHDNPDTFETIYNNGGIAVIKTK